MFLFLLLSALDSSLLFCHHTLSCVALSIVCVTFNCNCTATVTRKCYILLLDLFWESPAKHHLNGLIMKVILFIVVQRLNSVQLLLLIPLLILHLLLLTII